MGGSNCLEGSNPILSFRRIAWLRDRLLACEARVTVLFLARRAPRTGQGWIFIPPSPHLIAWTTRARFRRSAGTTSTHPARPHHRPSPCTAGRHDPVLVGRHHRLRAVAQRELRSADVGLDRLLGDHEPRGDLLVGQPARDQHQHLALPRGERVERGRAGVLRGARAKCAISRLVTVGASSASPAATTRTAGTSSLGRGVLEQEARSHRRAAPRRRSRPRRTSSA